jgi:hypothetical protein
MLDCACYASQANLHTNVPGVANVTFCLRYPRSRLRFVFTSRYSAMVLRIFLFFISSRRAIHLCTRRAVNPLAPS